MVRMQIPAIGGLLTLMALVCGPAPAGDSPPSGEQRVLLQVQLPADALLEIDTVATRSTGEVRFFQSPPLPPQRRFNYTLKASWQGKTAVRRVPVKAGDSLVVQFESADFQNGDNRAGQKPSGAPEAAKAPPSQEGFVTVPVEGRWWVFREGSKELAAFRKMGEPEKSVTRVNPAPLKVTLRAPDVATMEEYLTARPGFVTRYEDGRLWVFRKGAKELAAFLKQGELARHVIRIGSGPRGMTLKAPDRETLDDYLKAAAP